MHDREQLRRGLAHSREERGGERSAPVRVDAHSHWCATVSGPSGSPSVTRVPVPVGQYDLDEADGPSGYSAGPWTCSGGALTGSTVTVTAGSDVTCRVTNTLEVGQVTLVKNVVNTGGGPLAPSDWTLSASSADSAITGASGAPEVSFASVTPGTFTLSETSLAAESAGYTSEGWSCVDDDGTVVSTTGSVDVAPAESVICTVTNRWTGSTLTLRKQVAAAFGTPAFPDAWTLTAANGVDSVSGPGNSAAVTRQSIAPGTWTLTESDGPSGYDELGWTCSGATARDGVIEVAPSTDVVCVATNAGLTPSLTLVKELDNGTRGRAEPGDFELKARGPGNAALSGPTGSEFVTDMFLPPGEYIFSEDGPSGYDGSWTCAGTTWDGTTATLGYGETAICTATNVFVGGTLTLRKEVVGVTPDAPTGPASASDWELRAQGGGEFPRPSIEGRTGDAAVTLAPLGVGEYVLSETATADIAGSDYRSEGWRCTGGTLVGEAVQVVAGVDTVCTATNVYDPGADPDPDPGGQPGTGGGIDPGGDSGGGANADAVPGANDSGLATTGLSPTVAAATVTGSVMAALGIALLVRRRRVVRRSARG